MLAFRSPAQAALRALAAPFAAALLLAAPPAAAGQPVDVALVLAVDISNSMDPEEQALQREGFVQAFRDPQVHQAIRNGMIGRVAVTYVEWAASSIQYVVVPWTVMEGGEGAMEFAAKLAQGAPHRGPRTSISGAIDTGMRLLRDGDYEAIRSVIDISGDGANNQGRPVTQARDEALAQGVVINGLPIMLNRGGAGPWDTAFLDEYYRDCVIGGPGAFMEPVRTREQFAVAIRNKIVREVAGLAEPAPLLRRAQASRPATNCTATETPWFRN
ncbi:DUF1194 domain-containing protein [Alsobacter sp. SYSU M60028]|uniref:DUF1194 domain-containing protein n=1 Tax=Alsobacter ponti TaxID=2962936 RepID=A0ABT1LF10_9HYPH|nr:DUF1194 domain-containing protein [Alsobacter ponti]MCP8939488.1 DUF1194 domain-containing protein [Alsobacter ponti]